MTKIICEECGKVFDSTLKQCPNCGYKRYNLKNKKIIKKSVIITSIVLVITGSIILFNYFANKDINDFKKDIISNLEKYGVTDVTISSMYQSDKTNKYGYEVIVNGKSNRITEKEIFQYIDYMEFNYLMKKTSDYTQKHLNYYYPTNMKVVINDISYDKKICGYDCLDITDNDKTYTYNVETGEKKETTNNNNSNNNSNNNFSDNTYNKPTDSEARFMAQDICKSYLKSPSSAKWGKSVNVTSLGNDKYSVSGTVEAQNSYGATVSGTYFAYFTFTGSGYKDGYCSIVNN